MPDSKKPIPTETRRRLAAVTALNNLEHNAAALRAVLQSYQEAVDNGATTEALDDFDADLGEAVNALDETLSDWPDTRNDWLTGESRAFGDMEVTFMPNEEA